MKSIRISVAILLTVALFIQTRYFGPNREYTVEGRCGELTVQHTAPRNHKGDGPATLEVVVDGPERDGAALPLKVQGRTEVTDDPQPGWDYYPVHEIKKNDDGGTCLGFEIPPLPIGTRFLYRFVTGSEEENLRIILAQKDDKPMTLKYEGEVPAWVLIPHILCMFMGITLLFLALFGAVDLVWKRAAPDAARLAWWAWAFMFTGGLPFGIAMNWYVFRVTWEAVPFGDDITDNKTQVTLIFWGLASLVLSRRPGRHAGLFALAAGLLAIAMYLIPHSL